MQKMNRSFFERDTVTIAGELLGKTLVRASADGICSGRIVETEAYLGPLDKAAHTSRGRTARTEVLFQGSGLAYIYLIYGMYCCLNFSTGPRDKPECVLIRALEPLDGLPLMKRRRSTDKMRNLCSGPGKLCMALGLGREQNGEDLCGERLFVLDGGPIAPSEIAVSHRINVDYAEEAAAFDLRFFVRGNPYVSK